jgi:outer membrane protein TolC
MFPLQKTFKYRDLNFFLFLFISFLSQAQTRLTLNEALQIGLANNFDIRVAKNEAEFARESNTYGAAGYLPTVNATAGRAYQSNNLNQKFSSGLIVKRNGVASNQTNAGIAATWIFYDGGKMFITKTKQNKQQEIAERRIQSQILNFTDTLSTAYWQLVLANQDLQISQQEIGRTEERLKMASEQFRLGTRAKADQILAQIDLNVLKNRINTQRKQIEIRKGAFNSLIGRDPEVEFSVVDSVVPVQPLAFSELKSKVLSQNLQIGIQKENLEVTKLGIREIKSRGLPQIGLNTAFNFARNENKAGFALFNQTLGPTIGLSANVPIFNGVSINRLTKLASIELETRKIQLSLAENRLVTQLWRAVSNLEQHLETIESEKRNIELAKEYNLIVKGRFGFGQATSLELKDAEFQLSQAQTRLIQSQINAKIAEIQALRLTGELKME